MGSTEFQPATPADVDNEDLELIMLLPINATLPNAKHLQLQVKIPRTIYTSLQPIPSFQKTGSIEFVPHGETGSNWSEIIYVQSIKGRRVHAKNMADNLKRVFKQADPSATVLHEESYTYDSHSCATLVMMYKHKGKCEAVCMVYCSGPYDCSGVQYTVRVKPDTTPEKIIPKLHTFINAQANIVVVDESYFG